MVVLVYRVPGVETGVLGAYVESRSTISIILSYVAGSRQLNENLRDLPATSAAAAIAPRARKKTPVEILISNAI